MSRSAQPKRECHHAMSSVCTAAEPANGILQACRQGGLSAGAAAIYRQYDTLALASCSSPVTKPEQGLNDHRQRHDTPWSTLGLLGSELECP